MSSSKLDYKMHTISQNILIQWLFAASNLNSKGKIFTLL